MIKTLNNIFKQDKGKICCAEGCAGLYSGYCHL